MRAQLVVALVAALTLAAVPLYLMRHPSASKRAEADAGAKGAASASASALASAAPPLPTAKPPERIKLNAPVRVRCGASPKRGSEGNLCDALPSLEESLAKTIRENEACAQRLKQAGSINYVLNIDFVKKTLHVFPGASGDYRGPQARRITTCIERALPKPEWETIRHQYRYYTIAIMTTYTPEAAAPPPPAPPSPGANTPPGQPRFD
ncbi:MAG: hypothetical protein ACOY0T_26115 [Myxococcota bacterium]